MPDSSSQAECAAAALARLLWFLGSEVKTLSERAMAGADQEPEAGHALLVLGRRVPDASSAALSACSVLQQLLLEPCNACVAHRFIGEQGAAALLQVLKIFFRCVAVDHVPGVRPLGSLPLCCLSQLEHFQQAAAIEQVRLTLAGHENRNTPACC